MRGELDEGSEEDPVIVLREFEKRTYAALKSLPAATAAPACDWTKPADNVLEKSEDDLTMGMSGGGGGGIVGKMLAPAVFAVVIAYCAYYMYHE